jgi:hypothetical protein
MAQAVSRRPLTAEARVGPCAICGGQSGTGTCFSPSTSVSVSYITIHYIHEDHYEELFYL